MRERIETEHDEPMTHSSSAMRERIETEHEEPRTQQLRYERENRNRT